MSDAGWETETVALIIGLCRGLLEVIEAVYSKSVPLGRCRDGESQACRCRVQAFSPSRSSFPRKGVSPA